MKRIIITLVIICAFYNYSNAQTGYNPKFYDKAKHYQYRSMEAGPWEFYRKIYYNTLHRRYKRNYKPNSVIRGQIMGLTSLDNSSYHEQQLKDVKDWNERELKQSADRTVDLAQATVSTKFKEQKQKFLDNMVNFTELGDAGDLGMGTHLMTEYNRIIENKDIIAKAHLENSKRQQAYLDILEELKTLNKDLTGLILVTYNKHINKELLTKTKK